MCGIVVSSLDIPAGCERYVKNRGPDYTNSVTMNGIHFVHYLLHITGEKTYQPIRDDNIMCIFNGEIYNYKEILPSARSDSYSIVEAYKKVGTEFIKLLDGEFAIVLFDYSKNILILSGDIFKTKPLFYHIGEDIIISSYESVCKNINSDYEYKSVKPNEVLVFDLNTRKLRCTYPIYEFDLVQTKENYTDYTIALEKAILKRVPEHSIPLITLSSGLDSGAIACCLNRNKKNALFMTINKNEDNRVIQMRNSLLQNHVMLSLDHSEKNFWKKYLTINCEKCIWDWRKHPKLGHEDNAFGMGSMLGKSKIMTEAKKLVPDIKVLLSGIGADEVMAHNSYYSNGWGNVDFFPEHLETVFPWNNFYEGSMNNYLRGDEYVGGCFGFETRYPFCDKYVVQEFLWLRPELKNSYKGSNYKPALLHYLDQHDFPYASRKFGFNV